MYSQGVPARVETRGDTGLLRNRVARLGDGRALVSFVATVVAIAYYVANAWITGPVYLADEIGYLNNAAFLAGRFVDGASSYYAGYSILIAPLFWLSSEPSWVWQGVLVVNSALWGGVFWLLGALLRGIWPDMGLLKLGLVLVLVALYPANVVMSGYAFSQSAVAFFFLLAAWALVWGVARRPLEVIPHSLAVGFLCWIHPVGFAILAASVLTLMWDGWRQRRYWYAAVGITVSVAVALVYREVIDPWRVEQMTQAAQSAALHYPKFSSIISGLQDPARWLNVLGLFVGQFAALIVATFGLVLLGVFQLMRAGNVGGRGGVGRGIVLGTFVSLSVLGCIAISALGAVVGTPDRIDHWVYGRYVDPVMLPLLAAGLMAVRRVPLQVGAAVGVSFVGYWLAHQLGAAGTVNRVNISGFWPEAMWPQLGLGPWFLVGAGGILLAAILPRPLVAVVAAGIWTTSVSTQFRWHAQLLGGHSNPSEIVDFVRGNYDGGCVMFDTSVPQAPFSMRQERASLYSFSLFNYEYRKSGRDKWLESCDGPLLTYDPSLADHPNVSLVGMEKATELRVMVKGDPARHRYPVYSQTGANESYWITTLGGTCLVSGACLIMSDKELARATQVGVSTSEGLITSGRAGYLFFGPYARFPPGRYELRVKGRSIVHREALLDVASGKGGIVHASSGLAPADDVLLTLQFELVDGVEDLEVRLRVGDSDDIVVNGYELLQAAGRGTVD